MLPALLSTSFTASGSSHSGEARLLPLPDYYGYARLPAREGTSSRAEGRELGSEERPNLQVDATVLEVGVGGTYDSTNIVPQPITTGVTALGIDHIWVLGKTIPEIAHQKGGIYKVSLLRRLEDGPLINDVDVSQPGVPALAIKQDEGLDVLESRAKELGASSFTVIPEHPQFKDIKLGEERSLE